MLTKKRKEIYRKLELCVGNTPLYEIKRINIPNGNRIFAKEEWKNPTGSLFDRLYPFLFRIAEEEGKIVPSISPVIEVTTGNAGASFAWCARNLGYKDYTVIIHRDSPNSRIKQIEGYGAKIKLSPAGQYSKGCVKLLEDILKNDKKVKGGKIGNNPTRLYCVSKTNSKSRYIYKKLVIEVIREIEHVNIDYFIGAVGSGTSISGIGQYLKEYRKTKIIAVDPEESPSTYMFKYNNKCIDFEEMPHNVFGGATFGLPLNKLNINMEVIDDVKLINANEREKASRQLIKVENKPVGRTSGCVLAIALRMAEITKNRNFLICFYDPIWKYSNAYDNAKG